MPSVNDRFGLLLGDLTSRLALLPDKPEETAERTLRALWFTAAGQPRSAEAADAGSLPALSGAQAEALEGLLARRLSGAPLSHLTGRQRFLDLELLASPDALVPRKETELLAAAAIQQVQALGTRPERARVVDVCTGSGNVALAIARYCPQADVKASDLSERAVELAQRNTSQLGLGAQVAFSVGDLLAPFAADPWRGRVDVLTCNPPYISSAKVKRLPEEIASHEPAMAFDGGPLGIAILLRLVKEAPGFLRPGGWLLFEVGLGQGPSLVKMLRNMPAYQAVEATQDGAGEIRVVRARSRVEGI